MIEQMFFGKDPTTLQKGDVLILTVLQNHHGVKLEVTRNGATVEFESDDQSRRKKAILPIQHIKKADAFIIGIIQAFTDKTAEQRESCRTKYKSVWEIIG